MQGNKLFHGHGISEPIGLEYIAANLVKEHFEFFPYNRFEFEVFKLDKPHNKFSLISANTSEYNFAHELALKAKKRGNITLLGGYHASYFQKNKSHSNFDFVVVGEGEEITIEIINNVLNNQKSIPINGNVVQAPQISKIDNLPFPVRQKEFLKAYKLFDLMWPPASMQKNVALVLASRGCVYNCDFCASRSVWGKGIRYRSPSKVVDELKELKENFNTNTFVFIDQTFGLNANYTKQLCNEIENANLGMHWYNQSNLTIKKETIKAMANAGCKKIGFGLEGISPLAIEKMKLHNPYDLDKINDLFEYCNSLGIFVKVYLMIGSPWEDSKIISDYFQWITKIRANEIKISYLTPFPGTAIWSQYADRLLSKNWDDFDTVSMPVIYNPNISVEEYHQIRKELFRTFYSSPQYQETTFQMLRMFPHYIKSYVEFAQYLRAFEMIDDTNFLNKMDTKNSNLFHFREKKSFKNDTISV